MDFCQVPHNIQNAGLSKSGPVFNSLVGAHVDGAILILYEGVFQSTDCNPLGDHGISLLDQEQQGKIMGNER